MQARPFYWGASQGRCGRADVALLCTKSFDYEGLMLREIQAQARHLAVGHRQDRHHPRQALPLRRRRGDAARGADPRFPRRGAQGVRRVRGLPRASPPIISVGSVGSEDGYSSVLDLDRRRARGVRAGRASAGDPGARPAAGDRKARRARQVGGLQELQRPLRPGRLRSSSTTRSTWRLRGDRPGAGRVRARAVLSGGGIDRSCRCRRNREP